jgi:hypothetical protein
VKQGAETGKHRFVFVGGLHKSGTSLVARCLAEHPLISGFSNTGVPEDEGQHLQSVFLPAGAYGGPGKFGFDPQAHLTEASELVTEENRALLLVEWGSYWDLTKPVLLEKSPPNLIRMRFLQALFPEAAFVIVMRDPVAVAYATQKWSRTGIDSLIEHWLVCHEIFEGDRAYVRQLHVLKYEDLVERPQSTLDAVFDFLDVHPVSCGIEVHPEVNASYLRRWNEDAQSASTGGHSDVQRIRKAYEKRAAAFGYQLSAEPDSATG